MNWSDIFSDIRRIFVQKIFSFILLLTYFSQFFISIPPLKTSENQKFSGVIEMEHRDKMG